MASKLPSLLVACCAAAVAHLPAHAQAAYPAKPITAVVPLPAGGAADSLARVWAEYMSKALGQPVIIENLPGANGGVAAAHVAHQPANGYTLLFGSTSNMSLNPFSYKSLTYDPVKDFDPVLMLATTVQVLVTSPATGIKTFDDLLTKARAEPGVLNYGSAGRGNSTHLNVEYVAQHYKLQMQHIPYKGAAPAMVGLLGGETQITSDAITSVMPQARIGKIVPLLLFGEKRSAALPNVPTVHEVGMKDFPATGWYGLMAPKGTPKEVVTRLNEETRKFWADPTIQARMQTLYMEPPTAFGPDAVAQTMREEAKVWGPIIQRLGVRND